MLRYHYKISEQGKFILFNGKVAVAVYDAIDKAQEHSRLVTGADAKPASDEYEPQSVQPVRRQRGRPRKGLDT